MTLHLARRLYRGAVFDEWLEAVRGRGYGTGLDLVMRLGTPRDGSPGLGDNVYAGDQLLKAAEAEGLIRRASHDPGLEFGFFGVGGLPVRKGKVTAHSSAVEFGWVAK